MRGLTANDALTPEQRALVEANLGLAVKFAGLQARRYCLIDFDDVKQACFMGLIRAARLFDPSCGAKFGTYASIWMRSMLQREVSGLDMVKIPKHVRWDYKWHGRGKRGESYGCSEEGLKAAKAAAARVQGMHRVDALDGVADRHSDTEAIERADDVRHAVAEVDRLDPFLADAVRSLVMGNETLRDFGKRYRINHETARKVRDEGLRAVQRAIDTLA